MPHSLGMSKTLAGRLRRAREAANISARRLSLLGGASKNFVSNIETGTTTRPQAATLMAIARVLGVAPEYLLNGEGPAPTKDGIRAHVIEARKGQRLTA